MKNLVTFPEPQHAEIAFRFGKRVGFRATVEMTPRGMIAAGVTVSGILLSTAVIVATARRGRA